MMVRYLFHEGWEFRPRALCVAELNAHNYVEHIRYCQGFRGLEWDCETGRWSTAWASQRMFLLVSAYIELITSSLNGRSE